jgi:hypothetical protein
MYDQVLVINSIGYGYGLKTGPEKDFKKTGPLKGSGSEIEILNKST